MHEGVQALVGVFMPFVGEVEGEHGRFELGVSQVALDEPRVDTGFEPRGSVGMSEGMDGHAHFGDSGPVFGGTEGTLDTGAPHGGGRRRTLGGIPPGGGKEPGGVTVGFPVGAEQREGLCGQGDVPVFGALPAMHMDWEALAINVSDLEGEGFMEPEAQARDGSQGDRVVEGGGGREEALDLLHTQDGGETVGGLRTQEREGVPITFEDVRREEAHTAVAETHGGRREAVDVFPVQEGVLKLLFRNWSGELW